MRIVDVACATSFGLISLLVLAAVNPALVNRESQTALADTKADEVINGYLARYGLNFLATSAHDTICDSALAYSNGSVILEIVVDGANCPLNSQRNDPSFFLGRATTRLNLGERSVTIEAWVKE